MNSRTPKYLSEKTSLTTVDKTITKQSNSIDGSRQVGCYG